MNKVYVINIMKISDLKEKSGSLLKYKKLNLGLNIEIHLIKKKM